VTVLLIESKTLKDTLEWPVTDESCTRGHMDLITVLDKVLIAELI
jgi:hypothetical protein